MQCYRYMLYEESGLPEHTILNRCRCSFGTLLAGRQGKRFSLKIPRWKTSPPCGSHPAGLLQVLRPAEDLRIRWTTCLCFGEGTGGDGRGGEGRTGGDGRGRGGAHFKRRRETGEKQKVMQEQDLRLFFKMFDEVLFHFCLRMGKLLSVCLCGVTIRTLPE